MKNTRLQMPPFIDALKLDSAHLPLLATWTRLEFEAAYSSSPLLHFRLDWIFSGGGLQIAANIPRAMISSTNLSIWGHDSHQNVSANTATEGFAMQKFFDLVRSTYLQGQSGRPNTVISNLMQMGRLRFVLPFYTDSSIKPLRTFLRLRREAS